MSDEDRTRPIRDLLGALGKPVPRPMRCGGAIVSGTRRDWQAVARRYGVDFTTASVKALPAEGSGELRVECDRNVLSKPGVSGDLVHDGTCARCSGIERSVRAGLADLAARAEQEQSR